MRLARLCLALVGAGVCTAVQAEPVTAAVSIIGTWIGGTAGAYAIMNAAAIAAGVLKVGALAAMTLYQRQKAKREARRARDAYNASLTDRNVTVVESAPVVRHIYGRATVGGAVVHLATTGDKDQYKHVVVAWAGHECDAIEDIQIAGESIELDGDGNATAEDWAKTEAKTQAATVVLDALGAASVAGMSSVVSVVNASTEDQLPGDGYTYTDGALQVLPAYLPGWAGATVRVTGSASIINSQIKVRHHLGAADQLADAQLVAATAGLTDGKWRATDRLQGICYSVFVLDLNNPDLQGGLPQITATIRGAHVLDPRSGATVWTDNSALCAYDFLRSADYGKGVLPEQVQGVIAAANACDELITVTDGGETITAPRYRCNGAWTSDEDPDSVLEDICRTMAGFAVPGGAWRLQAGVYTAPVLVLDDDLAAGPISMVPAPGRADAWNGVRGQYIDPAQYNQSVDFEPLQVAAYVDDDGGEVWGALNLPFSAEGWRARTLAAISLEQSRARSLVWVGPLACLRAQVGDRVAVSNALLGLAGNTFRVTARQYDHTAEGCVQLTLTQDDPAYYASVSNVVDLGGGLQPDTTQRVTPPTGLVLSSPRAGVIRVQVAPSPDQLVIAGGRLLIQGRLESGAEWASLPSAAGSATSQTITGLPAGLYVVQVDWQSSTGRTSGQWAAGAVRVAESAYASIEDVSDAVATAAQSDNPVFTGVVALPPYTLSTLPPTAGDNEHAAIVVTNATAGPSVCVSNGTQWISQITGLPVA